MSLRTGKQKNRINIAVGYLLFFATIATAVTYALVVYEKVRAENPESKGSVSLAMLGAVLFISLMCTLIDVLRRRIMVSRPVNKILSATERIAQGDFSVRLEIQHSYGKYDEYDLIMENLNMVAEELQKNEILKTDFISNISHELKTPIAAIKNTAELLERRCTTEECRSYAENIHSASRKLAELIGNILTLHKLENQELASETEKYKLNRVLEECIVAYLDKADAKKLEISCDIDEFSVSSSRGKTEIIFNNLISNAVKFTDEGGKISISLKQDGSDAIFKISDTGIGMSPEDVERVFEKFYQADTSHATEGTGLGLPLVKKVVTLLGGEINIETAIGSGTSFEVRLRSCAV